LTSILENRGVDFLSPSSYEELDIVRLEAITQDILETPFLGYSKLPTLATPEEWVGGAILITTGIALYSLPFTRKIGMAMIGYGIQLIGGATINDFRDYAREKEWLTKEEWNIFNKFLDRNTSLHKELAIDE